jgi:polysaccharide biosynthesis protein PslG
MTGIHFHNSITFSVEPHESDPGTVIIGEDGTQPAGMAGRRDRSRLRAAIPQHGQAINAQLGGDTMARPSRPFVVVMLIAILLVGGVIYLTTQRQNERSRMPAQHFGIADPVLLSETIQMQAAQLAVMKAMGITSVRVDADWRMVQAAGPKTFNWTRLDRVVNSARAAGLSVDLIIDGCPRWAARAGTSGDSSPQPASSAQYATWAADVAARYAPKGLDTFEIWNEPNSALFWQPKPSPSAYTADLVAAYSAIKAVDPSAFVISGGLAPTVTKDSNISAIDFLKSMYADGAKGSFDALGYHPYSFPELPDVYGSGWSQMAQTSPSLRSVMISNGDSGKPIWITEFGAPSRGPDGVGEPAQATALTQAVANAKATAWIGALYIYTWQDEGTDPRNDQDWFGLLTAGGSAKPAYRALAAAIGATQYRHGAANERIRLRTH